MTQTNAVVEMDLTETGIVSDSTPSTTNNSTFADISEINDEHTPYNPFMTLEHNICILDGSLEVFDSTNLDLSYFSSTLSNNDCTTTDKITVTFNNSHSLAGVVLDFGTNSFLDKVTLTYFDGNTILDANDFYPSSVVYTERYGCEGFNKIKIEFNTTKFPRMFTRLQSIGYGFKYRWQGENIISCQINEEVNTISSKVPTNTCNVTIYDESNEFNVLNPKGVYKYLQTKQQFKVYGIVNDTQKQMGVYFLDTWDGNKPYEITFNLISPLGILDRTTYFEGGIVGYVDHYSQDIPTAYDCLVNILNDAGLTINVDYTISDDLKSVHVLGLIPICTHKEALQNVAFIANACIDDTRNGVIKIHKQNQDIRYTIDTNVLFDNVNVSKNEIVTGLDITLYQYDVIPTENDYKEIFKDYVEANQTVRIMSTEPIWGVKYSKDGGALEEYNDYTTGKFYFDFTASTSGTYLFQIAPFKFTTTIYKKRSNVLPNHKENILKIDKSTLLYDDGYYWGYENIIGNVSTFADNLMSFYEYNSLKVEFEYLSDGSIETGDRGSIFTEFNQYLVGSMVSQRINAGAGLLTSGVMIANNEKLTDYYFATDGTVNGTTTGQYELYDDDNILI